MPGKKKSSNPADSYPARKDKRGNATIGGGEGKNPSGPKGNRVEPTYGGAKNGTSMKKAKSGFAALAPPYDKATFADKIAGATKNKAKSGTKIKKAMSGYGGAAASMVPPMSMSGKMKNGGTHKMPDGSMMKNSKMKSGGSTKKCKYGCN